MEVALRKSHITRYRYVNSTGLGDWQAQLDKCVVAGQQRTLPPLIQAGFLLHAIEMSSSAHTVIAPLGNCAPDTTIQYESGPIRS